MKEYSTKETAKCHTFKLGKKLHLTSEKTTSMMFRKGIIFLVKKVNVDSFITAYDELTVLHFQRYMQRIFFLSEYLLKLQIQMQNPNVNFTTNSSVKTVIEFYHNLLINSTCIIYHYCI